MIIIKGADISVGARLIGQGVSMIKNIHVCIFLIYLDFTFLHKCSLLFHHVPIPPSCAGWRGVQTTHDDDGDDDDGDGDDDDDDDYGDDDESRTNDGDDDDDGGDDDDGSRIGGT